MSEATQNTALIVVTYDDGRLVARCEDEHTLGSNTIRWADKITAVSDSRQIADVVAAMNGVAIVSVEHDKDTVYITVDNSKEC